MGEGPDEAWYPVVESVTDNFGNDLTHRAYRAPTRLSVGGTVHFTCVGRDPQERVLNWTLELASGAARELDAATGSPVELTRVVDRKDVSERIQLNITLASDGEYHRHGSYDATIFFSYAVNPPA